MFYGLCKLVTLADIRVLIREMSFMRDFTEHDFCTLNIAMELHTHTPPNISPS